MSSLLQSKFFTRFFVLAVLFVGFFAVSFTTQAFTYTGVLQLGSTGAQVVSLQQKLGITPVTGTYDYVTRGAVVDFQLSQNLAGDGVVGPATGQALTVAVPVPVKPTSISTPVLFPSISKPVTPVYSDGCTATTTFSATTGKPCETVKTPRYPDGCKSTTGYSITTGLKCSLPVGCAPDSVYSSVTGQICDGSVPNIPLVAGCTSRDGYSATTGASCLTGTKSSPLKGTEGVLNAFTKIVSYTNKKIPEKKSNYAFAGYTLMGEKNSDIRIEDMRLNIQFILGNASNKLNKYVKNINITQGGTKVGSLDVANFSKSGATYAGKIELTGAILRSNINSSFYVTADTIDNIDSADADNSWIVTISQVRYTDGLNRVYYDSSTGDLGSASSVTFHFLPVKDTTP